jgi:microcystin degradation protein MlrC
MRIAIAGISIEVMLNSPLVTDAAAIQHYDPDAMREGDLWLVRGVLERLAKDSDIEAVPIYWATALPGGPLTPEAYTQVKSETLRRLSDAGPIDGIVLANHGALEVADLDIDGDTDFVLAIRRELGPDVPIALALDLHGDITPELLDVIAGLSVLRTAPHRDDRKTGYRAADQLIHVLRDGLKPKKAAVRIPMLIPGEVAVTALPPANALYGSLPELDREPGVIEANILTGFAWNDLAWTGATAVVITKQSADLARKQAVTLAQRIWEQRREFRLQTESMRVSEGLSEAANRNLRPFFLSDSGDNTTAGAPGDLTIVLQAALERSDQGLITVTGITAPEAVRICLSLGAGQRVTLDLGSEHVSGPQQIKRAEGVVEEANPGQRVQGFQPYRSIEGPWARVRFGNVIATFHSQRIGVTTPAHFQVLGIDAFGDAIHVVKLGYLHPQLEDIAAGHIMLLSVGASNLDMHRLTWSKIQRPMYPLDAEMSWSPELGLYGDR